MPKRPGKRKKSSKAPEEKSSTLVRVKRRGIEFEELEKRLLLSGDIAVLSDFEANAGELLDPTTSVLESDSLIVDQENVPADSPQDSTATAVAQSQESDGAPTATEPEVSEVDLESEPDKAFDSLPPGETGQEAPLEDASEAFKSRELPRGQAVDGRGRYNRSFHT